MGEVVALHAEPVTLDAAWEAYDAAQLRVVALYRNPRNSSRERRDAVLHAATLHALFLSLYELGAPE